MESSMGRYHFFSILVLFSSLLALSTLPLSSAVLEGEFAVTLDHFNFSETVAKHDFIVVEFYAPWCGHCQELAPEYEKAASVLSKRHPSITLAKINGDDTANRKLAEQFNIQGFPSLFILRDGGKKVQDYKGPRQGDEMVKYIETQLGPASAEIKSSQHAATFIDEKGIGIVGVFPEFSGEQFDTFISVAENLRSDYVFGHAQDGKLLPRGESSVKGPMVRLFNPFDGLYADSQDFKADALEKFIKENAVPMVTIFDSDPSLHESVAKFFELPTDKVMLVLEFSSDQEFHAFNSKYREAAKLHKGKNLGFLLANVKVSDSVLQFFGLKEDQIPVLLILTQQQTKYLEVKIRPEEIAPWLQDYLDGKLKPFIKSEPTPETNDGPVKVAVFKTVDDIVFKSGKNVFIEFYAPWCKHCKRLAPILEEVGGSFQNDPEVVIVKMDATANDIPDEFTVKGFPTMYFKPASGELVEYRSEQTKEAIIDFIQEKRHRVAQQGSPKDEL